MPSADSSGSTLCAVRRGDDHGTLAISPHADAGRRSAPYRRWMLERPRTSAGRRRRQDLVDLSLVLAMGAISTLETLGGNYDGPSLTQALVWDWLLILPLAVRRRFPMAVWVAVLVLMTAQATLMDSIDSVGVFFALLVGCYTVAAYCPRRPAIAGLVALVPVVAYSNWRSSGDPLDDLVFLVVLVGGFWVAGRVVWSREQLVRRLAEQADDLRRGREAEARAMVAEQRARIARDVHDVVAHSVSIMVVQAEAGEAQLLPAPPSAQPSVECLRAIQRVGRSTLTELRGVLSALGDESAENDALALGPTPRLRDARRLVSELEAAGLDVDFRLVGDPDVLPSGVDLAAYRILQEALTNTLRHAVGAAVVARVDVSRDDVVIAVEDSGAAQPSPVNGAVKGAGRGLLGMRERVRLYGGEIDCGPGGTGFRVRARIPVPTGSAAPG
jgi:signal transduction histidine kinase